MWFVGDCLSFSGRMNRSGFWKFIAVVQLPSQAVIGFAALYLTSKYGDCRLNFSEISCYDFCCFWFCFVLACLVSVLAAGVTVQRLHDLGLSGRWLLLFILSGSIDFLRIPALLAYLLILGCVRGSPLSNRFGRQSVLNDTNRLKRKLRRTKRRNDPAFRCTFY
ncbi:MAG: DUF805 domain-containing protein [Kiritimatiellia bacterium]